MSTSPADLEPPVRISLDADIVLGTAIVLVVHTDADVYQCRFAGPAQRFTVPDRVQAIGFSYEIPSGNLATPLLRAIRLEGDTSMELRAADMVAEGDLYALVQNPDGTSHLAQRLLQSRDIRSSSIIRPWRFTVVGHAPADSSILVIVDGKRSDGGDWSLKVTDREPTEIDPSQINSIQFQLLLNPSKGGRYTPDFEGIAIEGDQRRVFVSARHLVRNGVPEGLQFLDFGEVAVLRIAPVMPPLLGPPTAIERIRKLADEGKLKPVAIE